MSGRVWSAIPAIVLLDGLTEEQKHMQEEALKFARNEMSPYMRQWDKVVCITVMSVR